MKVVFIGLSDCANSAYWIAKSLETQGIETASWYRKPNVFQYPEIGKTIGKDGNPRADLEDCDFVAVVRGDAPKEIPPDKRIVIIHGGSNYRQNPKKYDAKWARRAEATLCYSADLMGLGTNRNEMLIVPPMDMKYFPEPTRRDRVRIGHFPSRDWQKGTTDISQVLKGRDTHVCTQRVPWLENLKRMRECEVVVDQIYPYEDGKLIGEWVAATTEAAASGCITIANSHQPHKYKDTYGIDPGIHICNTAEALATELDRIESLTADQVWDERMACREWIEKYHSLEPTGRLLVEKVFH